MLYIFYSILYSSTFYPKQINKSLFHQYLNQTKCEKKWIAETRLKRLKRLKLCLAGFRVEMRCVHNYNCVVFCFLIVGTSPLWPQNNVQLPSCQNVTFKFLKAHIWSYKYTKYESDELLNCLCCLCTLVLSALTGDNFVISGFVLFQGENFSHVNPDIK